MKKPIIIFGTVLIIVLVIAGAYAGGLSIFQQKAIKGNKDVGALSAYEQYGQSIEKEVQKENTKLKIEDIVRDGMQTKISFVISNIEIQDIEEFSPQLELRDNLGNFYNKYILDLQHLKDQKAVTGVAEFEPITAAEITSLEMTVRDRVSNLEWDVAFDVDPQKVGPEAKNYIVKKSAKVDKKTVELVEIVSTPSMSKMYLNSEVGLLYCEIKDTNGEIVSEIMQGFAPFEKQDGWTHELTFNPIPEKMDLVLEVHTKAGQTLEIPFKL